MYTITFRSDTVEREFYKVMDKLRSNSVLYRKAKAAMESLKTAPRAYLPGNKHPLTGDRKGTWALRLTPRMRLLYIIDDGALIVNAIEVSDHYK